MQCCTQGLEEVQDRFADVMTIRYEAVASTPAVSQCQNVYRVKIARAEFMHPSGQCCALCRNMKMKSGTERELTQSTVYMLPGKHRRDTPCAHSAGFVLIAIRHA